VSLIPLCPNVLDVTYVRRRSFRLWPDLAESTEVIHRTSQDNLAQDLNPDPNNKETVNSSIRFLIVKAGGIHSNHCVLTG
jgi:hypothetical protein